MTVIWDKMREIFGSKFTYSFGDYPNDAWFRIVGGLTREEITTGLEACLNWEDKFPPDAREFKKLCLKKKKQEGRTYLGIEYKPTSLLRMDKEKSKLFIMEARNLIRGKL